MALANDDNFRKQFRTANFHGGMLTVREGLMTEAEAIAGDRLDVDTIVRNAAAPDSSGECDLSFCRLLAVPPALLDVTALTDLNLEANQISRLPDEFGGLCFLTHLNLKKNRIHALPATMCMMDQLEVLDISNNLITHLPEEFADLNALRRLAADFNYLEGIPTCVLTGMASLQQLFLIENPLVLAVPETPGEWGAQLRGGKRLYVELDNAPELVASVERLQAALGPGTADTVLEVKWNKIWPDLIVDHVALGSLRTVQNMSAVLQLNVTHVLTCGRNLRTPAFPHPIKQLVLDVDDNDEQDMNQYFLRAIEFIEDCVQMKGLCIVHCFAGVSRSATVVVAYLMRSRRLRFAEALNYVQQHRPAANPNPNFRRQLQEFEVMCV